MYNTIEELPYLLLNALIAAYGMRLSEVLKVKIKYID
jgi:integrase